MRGSDHGLGFAAAMRWLLGKDGGCVFPRQLPGTRGGSCELPRSFALAVTRAPPDGGGCIWGPIVNDGTEEKVLSVGGIVQAGWFFTLVSPPPGLSAAVPASPTVLS